MNGSVSACMHACMYTVTTPATYTLATRRQDRSNLLSLLGGDIGRATPDSHTLPDGRGRVGHGPDDLLKAALVVRLDGLARDDTEQDRLLADLALAQLVPEARGQVLRLDAAQHKVGPAHNARQRVRRLAAVLLGDLLHGLARHVEQAEPVSRLHALVHHGLDHRLRHFARPNDGDSVKDAPVRKQGEAARLDIGARRQQASVQQIGRAKEAGAEHGDA
jgi:hypothetical protein